MEVILVVDQHDTVLFRTRKQPRAFRHHLTSPSLPTARFMASRNSYLNTAVAGVSGPEFGLCKRSTVSMDNLVIDSFQRNTASPAYLI